MNSGDRQSWIAWQTVNEVSKKSTLRAKLKAASQEEWKQMWKEHFKNLLGNSPNVTDKHIMKIINYKFDIKQEQFTQCSTNKNLKKVSCWFWWNTPRPRRQGNSMTNCFDTAMPSITRTQQRDGQKVASSLSPRKVTSELSKHKSYIHHD